MKKMLIVLLILGVAGGVFAQELTWSGSVTTGFVIDMGDSHDDPVIKADDDDVGVPVQARLDLEIADDFWGFKLGTGANIHQDYDPELYFGNAHGWIDFLGGMLRLRGGLIDDSVWATGGEIDDNVSSGLGTRLEVMPLGDKLNFGVFLNYDGVWDGEMTVKNWLTSTAFGASYEDPDLLNLRAAIAMKMSPEKEATLLDDSDPNPDNWIYDDDAADLNAAAKLIFAFGISPVPVLDILIDGNVVNLGAYGDAGAFTIYEEFTFTGVEDLTAGLLLGQGLSGGNEGMENFNLYDDGYYAEKTKEDAGVDWFLIKPWVEYAVTETWSAGLGIPLVMADNDGLAFASFGADLWAKYTIGGAYAKLGYGFTKFTDDFGVFDPGDEIDYRGHANHYIRVTFGYSF